MNTPSTQTCNFSNFPKAGTSGCANNNATDCVDTTNLANLKGKGKYDCICPRTYKLNNNDITSSSANSKPKITKQSGRSTNAYFVSCE
jgi:hypothetical protein